ncbi:MAG: hypothetical protein LUH21_16275 [Clostridiales bacterium]|nr:hypothetical protein [Clostridiales bacterium]
MKGWKSTGVHRKNQIKKSSCREAGKFMPTWPEKPAGKTHGKMKDGQPLKIQHYTGLGKGLGLILLAISLAVGMPVSSYASEKVGNIKIKFSSDEAEENGLPVIEAESDSERYSVNQVQTLEEYESYWEDDNDNDDLDRNKKDNSDLLAYNETYFAMKDYSEIVYAVELEASDGYYFTADMEKIKLSGLGAAVVRLERLNSKTTLTLFVRFGELDDLAGAIDTAAWSEDGYGVWASTGAAWYELRFYAGGKLRGGKRITGNVRYDFRPMMQMAGSYRYTVRPVSSSGEPGEWVWSDTFFVSETIASENKQLFAVITRQEGGEDGPPTSTVYINTGWQETDDGKYWYRDQDGSYPQMNWLNENGCWYYFDESGYMVTDTYIKWGTAVYYLDTEGKMLVGANAPDGRIAQEDGSLNWPET